MAKHKYSFTPTAKADLKSIWFYTDKMWGTKQADVYTQTLVQAVASLVENPLKGVKRDWMGKGCRSWLAQHHVIFYRIAPSHIEVVRILHKRMDVRSKIQRNTYQ